MLNMSEKTAKIEHEAEIHVPNSVSTPIEQEIHAPAQKTSFWQSEKFQWIIWIVGILIVGGIFLVKWLTTYPAVVNPTNAPITFSIDDKNFTLAPKTAEEAKISHGSHTVTINGQTVGNFDFGWFDGQSIINPTLASFVEEEVIYTVKGNPEAFLDKVTVRKIELDGDEYEGPYRLIEPALYIKKTWDFAPWEGSPEEVNTKSRSEYVIKKELHYIENFKSLFK